MISFFWKRGFYFNSSLEFYAQKDFFYLRNLLGISYFFINLLTHRLELLKHKTFIPLLKLKDLKFINLFVFNYYLAVTYPVLLNLKYQYKFNLFFYYLIRSFKGTCYLINRPAYRRTRGRTFKTNKKKILRPSYNWF